MDKQIDAKLGIGLLIALTIIVSAYIAYEYRNLSFSYMTSLYDWFRNFSNPELKIQGVKKFSSEQEFKQYLEKSKTNYQNEFGIGMGMSDIMALTESTDFVMEKGMGGGGFAPERVSETTVQVSGIDEPDIVKTNGKEIYFSSGKNYYPRNFFIEDIEKKSLPITKETKIIKAFPHADLAIQNKIDKTGNLLLDNDTLVIFSGQEIFGYDVSDSQFPEQKWRLELDSKNYLVSARLYKNKIYLVTQNRIDSYHPCPIKPFTAGADSLTIECKDIHHPITTIPVDTTFIASVIDPVSGKIENNLSFIGSSSASIVYMSEKGIYITYSYYESMDFFFNFFRQECRDIIPGEIIKKLEKLEKYDISESSKMMEFQIILEQYQNSLDNDERLKMENEITNRIVNYLKNHKRELEKTGIIKIRLDKFAVSANGVIPGILLNQFSLDEYDNYLRVAVTVGGNRNIRMQGFAGSTGESSNDIYVLDKNLKIIGSLKDLGVTERIYSARFVQDKGYLVTFKQIDPFFVIDLSEPKNPKLKGELKIPGYSSYLHPITKDKILGIGKEGSKVKISLFDVSSPEKPLEKHKYFLDEYWSDILNTHHAFLLDLKHQIFFMPGNRGGYVFSYKGDKLELKRAVSGIRAKRAVYINDYLYIIGDNKLVVLNELDWKEVNAIEFK